MSRNPFSRSACLLVVVTLGLGGCLDASTGRVTGDASPPDVSAPEVAPTDVAPTDVAPTDVAPIDVAPSDVAPSDVAPSDGPTEPAEPATSNLLLTVVEFSADGSLLVYGTHQTTAPASGGELHAIAPDSGGSWLLDAPVAPIGGRLPHVAIAPDGSHVAYLVRDAGHERGMGELRVWRRADDQTTSLHPQGVRGSLVFTGDSAHLTYGAGPDGDLRAFELATAVDRSLLPGVHAGAVDDLDATPVLASADGQAMVIARPIGDGYGHVYVQRFDGPPRGAQLADPGKVDLSRVRLDPSGTRAAWERVDGAGRTLVLRDLADDGASGYRELGASAPGGSFGLDRDWRRAVYLAVGEGARLAVDAAGVTQTLASDVRPGGYRFTGDGERVIYAQHPEGFYRADLRVRDLATGEDQLLAADAHVGAGSLSRVWSDVNGSTLAFMGDGCGPDDAGSLYRWAPGLQAAEPAQRDLVDTGIFCAWGVRMRDAGDTLFYYRTDEGRTDEGRTDEGRTDEGRTDEGHSPFSFWRWTAASGPQLVDLGFHRFTPDGRRSVSSGIVSGLDEAQPLTAYDWDSGTSTQLHPAQDDPVVQAVSDRHVAYTTTEGEKTVLGLARLPEGPVQD